ncbi:hypothetical protein [Sedimentibacter sp. MB31-C6]|uniref:hypothetical protein n=1 Tax=Sedimentibacter sp. MB31-C6 TaxID=3109366 RepID=UPI002DDCF76B|nr:hypothetical protein [Sedimentibacter sp. MB36-C1]WSI05100.1 hypothetical protein U8307_04725 [Sedimentibacter sp. MB36-C1]
MESGTILSTFLFLGPGFFMNIISDWIEEPRNDEESSQDSITKSFLLSFIILVINLLVLKFIFKININTFTELIYNMHSIEFFIKYFMLTFGMCFIIAAFKRYVWSFLVFIYNNLLNNKKDREYTTYTDLWNYIFYNSEFDISKHIFTIDKSGIRITQGFIKMISPKGKNKKSIIFELTSDVKEYLEDNDFVDKNLIKSKKEFYDLYSDVLVRAYNAEAILEDINKRIASAKN